MKYTALAVIISIWLAVPATAQIINSDPEFRREGPKAYRCTTPKGRQVICNRWHFHRNGWRKVNVKRNETVFGKLSTPEGQHISIRTPGKRHVALFDAMWADQRDYSPTLPWDTDAVISEFVERELRPAKFHQFVEIREAGQYQLRSCMTAKFSDDQMEGGPAPGGGIQVVLEQWHRDTVNEPTLHAVVPANKAKFGTGMPTDRFPWGMDQDDFEMDSVNMTWVDFIEDLPLFAERGDVVGVRFEEVAYVFDGLKWFVAGQGFVARGMEIDGYIGHAGLRTPYHEPWLGSNDPSATTEAIWSCHDAYVALGAGFYIITGRMLPVTRDIFSITHDDHAGFGAVRMILLKRVDMSHN